MSVPGRSLECVFRNLTRQLSPYYTRPQTFQVFIRQQPKNTRSFISSSRIHFAQQAENRKPSSTTNTTEQPASKSVPPPSPLPEAQDLESDASGHIDWSKSFHGLSVEPFAQAAADILLAPLNTTDIEIKPDGIMYLPEIKYRRILNRAFGPGGWGLAPRGEAIVTDKAVTREYALLAHGRLVSIARGEQDYFNKDGIPTASEGCKSNALMRCCKDLGVASELWDPRFIRKFKAEHTREVFVEHQVSKKRTKIWLRKGDPVSYPYKETKS